MLTNKTFDVEKKNGAFGGAVKKIPPKEEDGGDNTKNTEECVLDDFHYTLFVAHCNIFLGFHLFLLQCKITVVFLQK